MPKIGALVVQSRCSISIGRSGDAGAGVLQEQVSVDDERLDAGVRIRITSGRLAGHTGVITVMRATYCRVRLDEEFQMGQTVIKDACCRFRDIVAPSDYGDSDSPL